MQLLNYLTLGLKKSSSSVLLFLIILPIFAQNISTNTEKTDEGIYVSFAYAGNFKQDIFPILKQGLRSAVSFQIRIYSHNTHKLNLFGDQLVENTEVTKIAEWEPFNEEYCIKIDDETIGSFTNAGDFSDSLFCLNRCFIPIEYKDSKQYYILTRVSIEMMKLVPPFSIMNSYLDSNKIVTEWQKTVICNDGN